MNIMRERKMELCLCRRCLGNFFKTQKYYIRRLDPIEVIREPCMVCQVGSGYDFIIEPRDTRRKVKDVMRRDMHVIDRAV